MCLYLMMSQPIICIFILQEEQLQSSEREKLSKNRELANALEQLRQKVSRYCDSLYGTSCVMQETELTIKDAEVTRKEAEMTLKEAELTRAEETIRREQQQIQEMRQRVSLVCGVVCVVTRGPPDCRRPS